MSKSELTIFQQLCVRMVEDSDFAKYLLDGTGQERQDALTGFLNEVGYQGDQVQALDDLIVAVSKTDIKKMGKLRDNLDSVTPDIAI